MLENAPKSSWRPFEQNLEGTGDAFGNAQLETFSAMLTEWWRHFGKCPNKRGDLMGAFSSGSHSQ
jgi:hypothetical protein